MLCNFFVTHALQPAVFQDEFLGQDARDYFQVVFRTFAKHDLKRDLPNILKMLLGCRDEIGVETIPDSLARARTSKGVACQNLPCLRVSLFGHVLHPGQNAERIQRRYVEVVGVRPVGLLIG